MFFINFHFKIIKLFFDSTLLNVQMLNNANCLVTGITDSNHSVKIFNQQNNKNNYNNNSVKSPHA